MKKNKTLKLQNEIIDIFKRERMSPSDAIGLIEIVKANIVINLLIGVLDENKTKD